MISRWVSTWHCQVEFVIMRRHLLILNHYTCGKTYRRYILVRGNRSVQVFFGWMNSLSDWRVQITILYGPYKKRKLIQMEQFQLRCELILDRMVRCFPRFDSPISNCKFLKFNWNYSLNILLRYLWKFCWNNLRLYFGDNTVNSSSIGCFSVPLHLSKFLSNYQTAQFYKFHKLLLNLPEILIKISLSVKVLFSDRF